MKPLHLKSLQIMIATIASTILLSGCSSHEFRNRNFDYLGTNVQQMPALHTPEGVNQPHADPYFVVPAGQDDYPALKKPNVNMAPPTINEPITSVPEDTAQSLADHSSTVVPAAKSTQSMMPSVPVVVTAPTKASVAPMPVVNKTVKSLPASVIKPSMPVESTAPTAQQETPQVAQSTNKPLTKPIVATKLPALKTQLSFDSNNVGTLTVYAPLSTVWTRIALALNNSPYYITDQDNSKGFYFISPRYIPAAGHKLMLSASPQNKAVIVQIYNMIAALENSDDAHNLLVLINNELSH